MQKNILALVACACCLIVPVSGATISIVPTATTVSMGSTFTLDVDIADVIDLYAYQFDLSFTPGILSANQPSDGLFLSSGGFFPGFIDNAVGTISFIADSLIGPVPGISGSGTLATIEFLAIAAGTSAITVANPILLDSNLSDIPVQLVSSQVTVGGDGSPIPEPGTVPLVLMGAAALTVVRLKSKSVRQRSA